MKYFLISCTALLLACGSYPKDHNLDKKVGDPIFITNPYFSDITKDYVYKAKIAFADKSFGGLFVVKKLGKDSHRIVFTTEMGNKILDFSFIENEFKVNFILKEMNKKIIVNLLKRDFYVLINENPNILNHYEKPGDTIYTETLIKNKTYFYLTADQQLHQILETHRAKEKADYRFLGIVDNHAREIIIRHKNIKLNINLKAI